MVHPRAQRALLLRTMPLEFEAQNGLEALQVRSTCIYSINRNQGGRDVLKCPGVASMFVGVCVCLEQAGPRRSCPSPGYRAQRRGSDDLLVVDRFVGLGTVFRETDVEWSDLETTIVDLMFGQFNDPIRVVAFNTAEGWALDVSKDIAFGIQSRCDIDG
jgi:hypothetical protein